MLMVLGAGMLFVFWAIWPMLPARLPEVILPSLSLDGVVSILMLLAVVAGLGKLMAGS
jgi:hypothetical protein